MRCALIAIAFAAACGGNASMTDDTSPDMTMQVGQDMATDVDLSQLMSTVDMTSSDFASSAADLATPPDLTPAPDLVVQCSLGTGQQCSTSAQCCTGECDRSADNIYFLCCIPAGGNCSASSGASCCGGRHCITHSGVSSCQ